MSYDPSEALTRRELFALEDEDRAEAERELVNINEEIQAVKEDLVWWRSRSSLNLSQQQEAAVENVRLSYRLMTLTRDRVLLERQADVPSEVTAWEGYSA